MVKKRDLKKMRIVSEFTNMKKKGFRTTYILDVLSDKYYLQPGTIRKIVQPIRAKK